MRAEARFKVGDGYEFTAEWAVFRMCGFRIAAASAGIHRVNARHGAGGFRYHHRLVMSYDIEAIRENGSLLDLLARQDFLHRPGHTVKVKEQE